MTYLSPVLEQCGAVVFIVELVEYRPVCQELLESVQVFDRQQVDWQLLQWIAQDEFNPYMIRYQILI